MNYIETGASDWIEMEYAMYLIGCSLGIFPPPSQTGYKKAKAIINSNNDIEETLELVMKRLFRNNILLLDERDKKYRWNPDFSIDKSL